MSSTQLSRGQTVAHYRILDKIGEGGMASVYKAIDLKLGRTVALKLIDISEDIDEETKMRFIREARLAAQLNHPGITTIYEINEDEGVGFISMEYIDGLTLKEVLAHDGPLELRRFFRVARAICEAIAEAHRHGIVHRDLKLPNIMQTARGDIKVMDFGIAKPFDEEGGEEEKESITARGMTLGTVEYMSPEQILGERLDGRSDVFSTGVLFFELLTGQLPFAAQGQMQTFRAILKSEPTKLRSLKPELPERLEQILDKALQKERVERYQSVDALSEDLKALHHELFAPPSKGLSLRVALALATVLVAAGLLVGWQLFGRSEGPPGLAVLYFENKTDAKDANRLGRMVTNLLITSLSSDGSLAVLSNQKLYDLLKRFGQSDALVASPEVATKVAQAAGAATMVVGSISEEGGKLRLDSKLVEVESGKELETQQAEGEGDLGAMFALVDTLAQQVRDDLKLKAAEGGAEKKKSLAAATTASPEAYREYVVGLDLLNRYNLPDAKAAFERAIARDPNFALAYYRLAMTQAWWEPDPEIIRRAKERLGASLDELSARDRDMVEAFLPVLDKEYGKSLELYRKLNTKYPDEKEILYWIGDGYQRLERQAEAIPYFERVLRIDRDSSLAYAALLRCYVQTDNLERGLLFARTFLHGHEDHARAHALLGDIHQMRGEMGAALERYEKAIELDPGFQDAIANMAGVYVLQEKWDEALRRYEQALALVPENSSQGYLPLQNMGLVAVHQGRFELARQYFERKRALGEKHGNKQILSTSHQDKSFAYFVEGKLGAALEEEESAHSSFGGEVRAFYRAYKGLIHLRRGELDKAREEAAKIADNPYDLPYRLHLEGWILVAEGKAQAGVEKLESCGLKKKVHYYPINLYALAEGYEALGQHDKAQAVLAELVRDHFLIPIGTTSIVNRVGVLVYPLVYYRLGLVAEQRGDLALAHNCYTRFLQLWSAAPDQPEKLDAKKRLAALAVAS